MNGEPASDSRATAGNVHVSVVIACLNSSRFLAGQLEALASQRYPGPWEVIVADNGSTDDSRAIAESFFGCLPVRVVDASARRGPSYARNVGAAFASADKLLFVDADDVVCPGYVDAMTRALASRDFVTSRVDCRALNEGCTVEAHGSCWQETGVERYFGFLPAAAPCNFGITRRAFDRAGGFAENYHAAEDIAFSWKVQLAGFSLSFVADAKLRYRYRRTLGGLFKQTVVWGSFLPLLYRDFHNAGMAGRSPAEVVKEWADVAKSLVRARSKKELAPAIVRLGYCVGRVIGSVRHRTIYL